MDMQSITRWEDYSRAKDTMMQFTDISDSPWYTVESEDKKSSRLNVIAHLLSTVPYAQVNPRPVEIPNRPAAVGYHRPPRESNRYVPDHAHTLTPVEPKAKKGGKAKKSKADKPGKEQTDAATAGNGNGTLAPPVAPIEPARQEPAHPMEPMAPAVQESEVVVAGSFVSAVDDGEAASES